MQAIIQDLNIKLVRSRISGVNSTEINSVSSFVLLYFWRKSDQSKNAQDKFNDLNAEKFHKFA